MIDTMKRITPLLFTLAGLLAVGCNQKAVEEAGRLRTENDAIKQEVFEAKITIERQKAELNAAHQRVSDFEGQLTQCRGELATARKECADLKADLASYRTKAEQITQEKAALEKQITAADAERARNAKGTLVGAVSYFFNNNYGDKPDSGSKIFIISTAKLPELGQKCRKYLELKNTLGSDETKNKEWKDAGDALAQYLLPVLYDPQTTKLMADGSGAFSMKLAPGKYSIIVKSAHRTALTVAEVDGSMLYFETEIKPDEQANVAARFSTW
jgi:hypothetical protein